MEFTTEMPRIAHEINRAAEERAGRLCRIRADTHHFLSAVRANRLRVAKSQTAARLLWEALRMQAAMETIGKRRREMKRFLKEFAADVRNGGRLFCKALMQLTNWLIVALITELLSLVNLTIPIELNCKKLSIMPTLAARLLMVLGFTNGTRLIGLKLRFGKELRLTLP